VPRGVALQFLLQKHENIRNDLQFILHDVDRIVGKYLQLDAKLSEFARSQVYSTWCRAIGTRRIC
jgi:hypothetical protein